MENFTPYSALAGRRTDRIIRNIADTFKRTDCRYFRHYRLIIRRPADTGTQFPSACRGTHRCPAFDRRSIVWRGLGLSGFCPETAIAAIGYGRAEALLFMRVMCAGI
ncbi:MAG: hypothetical protein ACXV74_13080 [Methylobacter sp.]